MSHSNSSLNCFAACMAKYKHAYVLHSPKDYPDSPHLTFGTMAHEVLEKAGRLRDEISDGVFDKEQYYTVIPSELLYEDLKHHFNIKSWRNYFIPIIDKVKEYEQELVNEMLEKDSNVQIFREVKLQMTVEQLLQLGVKASQPLVGVIDLLIVGKTHATIIDYKFSTSRKSQDDFDMNSQLPLYSFLVHCNYDVPLHNIKYGYIDIPKVDFAAPTMLSNGKLSRAKDANVLQETFEKFVKAVHGDDATYNCEPGGYYYDAWCNYANNKVAYLSAQYLDFTTYDNVISDIFATLEMVDFMKERNMTFLKKYDAYTCKSCEYLKSCKPWLTEVW